MTTTANTNGSATTYVSRMVALLVAHTMTETLHTWFANVPLPVVVVIVFVGSYALTQLMRWPVDRWD